MLNNNDINCVCLYANFPDYNFGFSSIYACGKWISLWHFHHLHNIIIVAADVKGFSANCATLVRYIALCCTYTYSQVKSMKE